MRVKLNDLLSTGNSVPRKQQHQAKLHGEETVLGDALPRSRLPKSLREFYGNSMDAESRVMMCNDLFSIVSMRSTVT